MSGFERRFLPKPDGIFQKKPSVSLVVCGRGYQIVTDAVTRFGLQPIVLALGGSPSVLPQLNHQWIFQGGGREGLHCVVEVYRLKFLFYHNLSYIVLWNMSGCYPLPWTTAAAHIESYMLRDFDSIWTWTLCQASFFIGLLMENTSAQVLWAKKKLNSRLSFHLSIQSQSNVLTWITCIWI